MDVEGAAGGTVVSGADGGSESGGVAGASNGGRFIAPETSPPEVALWSRQCNGQVTTPSRGYWRRPPDWRTLNTTHA